MKDNISIIFTAIIGTFLIVLLPLYSILDRQDSMSYNVVLTSTTNFVDNIRNNGFLDRDSYYDYISALASTSNTYKVTLEAYRKTLIHETDEFGNVIPDSYVEEIELYNTQDILEVLENETNVDVKNSNIKNNVYLFDQNDEIYVKVYNTNMTAGSVIYNVIAGTSNSQVINVSYGGVINNVNWELYDKLQVDTALVPEVVMSVPVNGATPYPSTNIMKITDNYTLENLDCMIEDLEEYIGETSIEELCGDTEYSLTGENYTYLYDLSEEVNKTIKVAVELRRFKTINTGIDSDGNEIYKDLSELTEADFNAAKSYIITNFIELNGMYAAVDLRLKNENPYYVFEIILTNVRMSALDYISSLASVTVLPGLGQDENGTLSIGAETVQIELTDETSANMVTISMPHIWQKLLTTKSLTESRVLDANIYANEEVAFVISYTGINDQSDEDIVEAIEKNLKIYITETEYSDLEIYTAQQLNNKYGINISTATAGHVVVKFKYNTANNSKENYIQLLDNWIETNIEDVIDAQDGEELRMYAMGARSSEYAVLLDDSAPIEPKIALEGTLGNNGWYKSDVVLNLIGSRTDTIKRYILDASSGASNESVVVGGSGVAKNTLILEGVIVKAEQELTEINLATEGISYATAKSYDYVGNVVTTDRQEIKIDKTRPTAPIITLSGEEGINGWYKSNVTINITPGTDSISGVDKTTYRIEGANQLAETTGTRYILTNEGKSTIIVTTYDKAGNETTTQMDVSIDKAIPPDASITVIKGDKNSSDNLWYYTDVTLRITVDAKDAVSGLGQSSYRITGSSEVPTTQFDGTTKEITITENGTHNITVYTYTMAGNYKVTRYTVNIDKNAPNMPTVSVASGTVGENDWYTSDVNIAVVSNGDVGPSVEQRMTYTITHNGATTIEREIKSNEKIPFNEEGEYLLKVYSTDTALNVSTAEKTIKIDKTNPKAADFVITGSKGVDDWYISDVEFGHEGAADDISGIQSVVLSANSITQNTAGTKVTLTTKDVAGHTVTKEVTIKLDKSIPTTPTINLLEQPTGEGVFGVMLYNKDVEITVTPGEDYFLPNVDNLDRTTYEVTDKDGTNVIIPETEATSLTLTEEGRVTVIARTYDKAGNVAVSSKVIWIDKTKQETPKITNINDTNVENTSTQEIVSTSNKISLQVDNLTEGNNIKIVLINQSTYERIEINKKATINTPIEIELSEKGRYSITLTQTNMFGTESNISTGLYYYKYE